MTPTDDTNSTSTSQALLDPGLAVQADRRLIRANGRSERFLLVGVTAPTVAPDPSRRRPPVNLGFVLDRSGSMGSQRKLGLARQAVLEASHRLDDPDRFSVVVYDNEVEVVMSGVLASAESKRLAATRLDTVDARGSTDLHGGWLAGCEQVAAGLQPDGVNRVLLLTDGLANVGVTDHDELVSAAHDLRRRGVTTSTFGVGTDFDETLLQGIADAGGGHFYFIGDVAQMRDHITSEVGETLEVVAREVVLELTLPESVRVDSLSPFRVERRGGRALVFLGDMVSGQALSLVLRVTFDYGEIGREVGIGVRIADRDGAFERARPALDPVTLAWTYADSPGERRAAARPGRRPRRRPPVRRAGEAGGRAAQPPGPVRRRGSCARRRPQARRGVRGIGSGAARDRGRAPPRGAGVRGGDARDGAQAAVLPGQPAVPGPDARREVAPARADRAGIARRPPAAAILRGHGVASRPPLSPVLRRATAPDAEGRLNGVTPALAGWAYLGLAVHRLEAGTCVGTPADARERLLIVLEGHARVEVDDEDLGVLGSRATVFDGPPATVVLVEPGRSLIATAAAGGALVAVASAPGGDVAADGIPRTGGDPRGGSWIRPLGAARAPPAPARRRGGPAHRVRDVHARPATGRAGRRTSTTPTIRRSSRSSRSSTSTGSRGRRASPSSGSTPPDGTLDETVTARRPATSSSSPAATTRSAAAPDDDCYYLSVMAGPTRAWHVTLDPDHATEEASR